MAQCTHNPTIDVLPPVRAWCPLSVLVTVKLRQASDLHVFVGIALQA